MSFIATWVSSNESSGSGAKPKQLPLTSKSEFQLLFKEKRKEQISAVNSIATLRNNEQKMTMVKTVFTKIFEMQEESRALLENSAYVPGDSGNGTPILPRKQKVLESLSSVLENCALLSDVILRLPMISKRLLFENNKWFVGTQWCISFTNSTGLIDETTHRLLNLVAQELDIIPKDKNYYNPFDEHGSPDSKSKFPEYKDEKKGNEKQKKRKISKGPKLSKKIEL